MDVVVVCNYSFAMADRNKGYDSQLTYLAI